MRIASLAVTAVVLLVVAVTAFADVSNPAADESFQIESVAHAGQLLRVRDANSADGTPIVLCPQQAWRCMTWQLQADGDGFRLRNHFTKKTLARRQRPRTPQQPTTRFASCSGHRVRKSNLSLFSK